MDAANVTTSAWLAYPINLKPLNGYSLNQLVIGRGFLRTTRAVISGISLDVSGPPGLKNLDTHLRRPLKHI